MLSKLIVALDVDSEPQAMALVDKLGNTVSIFKVGLQLFTIAGPSIVKKIQDKGAKVFLDLKLHDIPNTVGKAVEAGQTLGVLAMSIHLSGGREMLQKAVAIKPRPQLWGVTVLTSLNDENLKDVGVRFPVREQVQNLGRIAKECQLEGIICSPQEIKLLRSLTGDHLSIITPGVRPSSVNDDQKRTLSPVEAVKAGADYIVIGRPIIEAADPAAAARNILTDIGEA